MIKALVSLDADLTSSIALRYSCRLTELVEMKLHTIHVEEVDKDGYPPGSGWVRSTWEKGLVQTAEEEIAQLINTEKSSCPTLEPPIVGVSEREDTLLNELKEGSYDLFIEGVFHSFNAANFNKKLKSKLYSYAPCPIILVKNLVDINKVALLLRDDTDPKPLISTFLNIFENSKLTLDLIHVSVQKSSDTPLKIRAEDGDEIINSAKSLLTDKAWEPNSCWVVQDTAGKIGDFLGSYGLVAAHMPGAKRKKGRMLELLSRVPSATLLCGR